MLKTMEYEKNFYSVSTESFSNSNYYIVRNIFNVIRNYRGEEGEISFSELKKIKNSNPNSILLDVRSPQEYKEGHLNGAINIPLYELERCCSCNLKEKNKTIIVYCQSGLDGIADFPIQ